jgi:tRNA(Arg) A34 adenosine deaminase TadA
VTAASEADRDHLRSAIALAAEARASGNHPFGAVMVAADGAILVRARNTVAADGPTGHAELNAVRAAAHLPAETLAAASLYSSTEPCAMCAGAIYWAGIGRLVYAQAETTLLTLTGADPGNPTLSLPCRQVLAAGQRPVEIVGPDLEDEASAVHAGFWTP